MCVFICMCVCVCLCVFVYIQYVCMCVDICVCVYVFIQDPDPGSDPKKIIPDPQHWLYFSSSQFRLLKMSSICVQRSASPLILSVRDLAILFP
jgi:hypothetical protein